MRVALITCRQLPEPDPDQDLLLAALLACGMDARMHAWDGEDDLGGFDLAVLRSCWNYHLAPQRFAAWLDAAEAATRLENPPRALRWNLHKSYLQQLAARALPIVPTVFVERGSAASFAAILDERGWSRAVVKPSISAASFRTRTFARDEAEAAQGFLAELLAERDAMVQRYMPSVERGGEKALVWIDGTWTHGVHKTPRFQGADEQVSAAVPVDEAERAFGDRVLAAAGGKDLLYARLDVIRADDGTPRISELELLEPSLFLQQHPPALRRFAAAIATRASAAKR